MASDSVSTAILSPSTQVPEGIRKSDNADRIKEAASQFEALLIGQMLKAARETGSGGWLSDGEDQTGTPLTEMAEGQLASLMASQGGFGLAKMVVTNLTRKSGG